MNPPNISESEWTVMEALWQRSPQTASEVASALRKPTGWAVNTVRTLLSRLLEKGAVRTAAENAAGVRTFAPAVARELCVRAESESFLQRVFQGAANPLLVHFASNSKLTPEEVRKLKRLLDQSLKSNPKLLMNAPDLLFTWFLAATLRGTLLAFSVVIFQIVFRRWLSAQWRYALWLPVVFVLAAPSLPQSRWSLERWLVHHEAPARPVPHAIEPETSSSSSSSSSSSFASSSSLRIVAERPFAPTSTTFHPRLLLADIWLTGAGGALLFMLASYTRTLRQMRRGAVSVHPTLAELVSEASVTAGLAAPPRLLVSNLVQSPAVCGLFRPVLLLPAEFPRGFDREEARLVLFHEMTHLARRDLPMNWLLCLLQALHWCNPALAFIFQRIRADREMACDAQVLAKSAGDSRADYGHALLKLEGALAPSGFNLGFVGVFGHASSLRTRIGAIADYRRRSPIWSAIAVLIVALLAITGATRAQDRAELDIDGLPNGGGAFADDPLGAARIAAIKRKMSTIIFPKLDIKEETPFLDILAYLQSRSALFDPEKKGINIRYEAGPPNPPVAGRKIGSGNWTDVDVANPPEERFSLTFEKIPLDMALHIATATACARFRITENGVLVRPFYAKDLQTKEWKVTPEFMKAHGYRPGDNIEQIMRKNGLDFPVGSEIALSANQDRLMVKSTDDYIDAFICIFTGASNAPKDPPKDPREKALAFQHLLDTTVFKQFDLQNATIFEATDVIRKLSAELDPKHLGVYTYADFDPSPSDRRITLSLRNVSLSEVIRSVANLTGLKCNAEGPSIAFRQWHPLEESYISKQWNVSPAKLYTLGCAPGTTAEDFLESKGIGFPRHAYVEWHSTEPALKMRNSRENIEKTEALLGLAGAAAVSQ